MILERGYFSQVPTQFATPCYIDAPAVALGPLTLGDVVVRLAALAGAAWLGYKVIEGLSEEPRDTSKYLFIQGGSVRHGGITNDLDRREREHRRRWPDGHIRQVGRRTKRSAGRTWERRHGF